MVAGNFGKSNVAAAPTMIARIELTTQQKYHVASAIDQLESNLNRSNAEELALNVLKAILPERLPTETQLLPNYPNPFNLKHGFLLNSAKTQQTLLKYMT